MDSKKEFLFSVTIVLLTFAVAIAQWSAHPRIVHFIKKHTTNVNTVQRDTITDPVSSLVTVGDTLWTIDSTAIDTSRIYETWPEMAFLYLPDSGATSIILRLYMSINDEYEEAQTPPTFGNFAYVDSVLVDSTVAWFTVSGAPKAKWFYLTGTGSATNDSVRTFQLKFVGYDVER